MSATAMMLRYNARIRLGQCVDCGSKAPPECRRCEPCKTKKADYMRDYYVAHRQNTEPKRLPKAPRRIAPAETEPDEVDDLSGARCRCGLRLPCNNCLPTTAVAWQDYAGGTE